MRYWASQAIQSGVAGLEQAQAEGLRALAEALIAAVEDSEASLQRSVQAESRRSLDALHRLPALLAASLPVTDVTPFTEEDAQQQQQLLPRRQPPAQLPGGGGLAPADRAWLQEVLRGALEQATQQSYRDQVSYSGRAQQQCLNWLRAADCAHGLSHPPCSDKRCMHPGALLA